MPNQNGAQLLDEVNAFVRKFVRLTDGQGYIVTVWIAHTHAFSAARETAYLAIQSAEKQSGKTRLLEVLELLVNNPWLTGRVTVACLMRKIDKIGPTLLLDESDAAFQGEKEYADALRGLLNTGHREDGKHSCCVGQGANIDVKDFKTFCPKAIAGIGKNLPDTVMDRSIPIYLKRQAAGERVERFRRRDVKPIADDLRLRIYEWTSTITADLREARPALPEQLSDRRQDGLEPLLAIAESAGGEWPEHVRKAALEIFSGAAAEDQSSGVQLLADIKAIFEDHREDKIASEDLVAKLREIETSPWADMDHGKGISKGRLARLLKKYEVAPRSVRLQDGRNVKGYMREWFSDPWRRYPLSNTQSENVTPSQPACLLAETHFSETSQPPPVTDTKSAPNPHEYCVVTPVTFSGQGKANGRAKGRGSSIPSCAVCGSFSLYRYPDGRVECQTCGGGE